ncbi:MAG: hypothetical protein AAFP83_17430, partial [Bacteroidota bacterium]
HKRGITWERKGGKVLFWSADVVKRNKGCFFERQSKRRLELATFYASDFSGEYYQNAFPKVQAEEESATNFPFETWNQVYIWKDAEQDTRADYDFSMVAQTQSGIHIIDKNGRKTLGKIDKGLFLDLSASFMSVLAKINLLDPNFRIIRGPDKEHLRAVIAGSYKGRPYLIGVNNWGTIFHPVQLGNKIAEGNLIAALTQGGLKDPLREIMNEWYENGKREKIVACLRNLRPQRYPNPEAVWSAGISDYRSGSISGLSFILSSGEVIGPDGKRTTQEERNGWYRGLPTSLKNAFLAQLAYADPYAHILGYNRKARRIAICMGDPDNVYILEMDTVGGKPRSSRILDFTPPEASRALLNALSAQTESYFSLKPPLDSLVDNWLQHGVENKIVACLKNGKQKSCANPEEAWSSGIQSYTGGPLDNINLILSDGSIIGPGGLEGTAPWYEEVKSLGNVYLMMLAIVDHNTQIVKKNISAGRMAIMMGNPDNLYVLSVRGRSAKPKVDKVLDLDDPSVSRKLLRALSSGTTLKNPLDRLVDSWLRTGNVKRIVACLKNGVKKRCKNPEEAWSSGIEEYTGGSTANLTFILSDNMVIGPQGDFPAPTFEQMGPLQNVYITMLAMVDPGLKIKDFSLSSRRVALLMGDPDNLYILTVGRNNSKPRVDKVLDLGDAGDTRKLIQVLTRENEMKEPLKQLVGSWLHGDDVIQIQACFDPRVQKLCEKPQDAWSSGTSFSGTSTENLIFILSNGRIISSAFDFESAAYDQLRGYRNRYLLILAIVDREMQVLDTCPKHEKLLVVVMGNPDNIYLVKVPPNINTKPCTEPMISSRDGKVTNAMEAGYCKEERKFYRDYYQSKIRYPKCN